MMNTPIERQKKFKTVFARNGSPFNPVISGDDNISASIFPVSFDTKRRIGRTCIRRLVSSAQFMGCGSAMVEEEEV
jgi:hypothetical protein